MYLRTLVFGSFAGLALSSAALAQSPAASWNGFYGGISVGGAFSGSHQSWSPVGTCGPSNSVCFTQGPNGPIPYLSENGPFFPGFLNSENGPVGWPAHFTSADVTPAIGFALGYNHQLTPNIVIGIEDELNVFAIQEGSAWSTGQMSPPGPLFVPRLGTDGGSGQITSGPRWLNLLTGRFGFAFDQTLIYMKGGLALGEVHLSTSAQWLHTPRPFPTWTANWAGSQSATRVGFAIGVGLEQALSQFVSFKIDATYYDLARLSTTATGTAYTSFFGINPVQTPGKPQPYTVSQTFDGVLVTAGMNFHF